MQEIPVQSFRIVINPDDLPTPPDAGILRQRKVSAIPAQTLAYVSPGNWAKLSGGEVELKNVSAQRAVKFGLCVLVGRDMSGMADFAVYRNGVFLRELSGAVYLQNAGDVVCTSPFDFDETHGGGDVKYEFYWKCWSGNVCTGGRYDGQYVTNRVGWCFAEEYQK
jgi:hypothetical protein